MPSQTTHKTVYCSHDNACWERSTLKHAKKSGSGSCLNVAGKIVRNKSKLLFWRDLFSF